MSQLLVILTQNNSSSSRLLLGGDAFGAAIWFVLSPEGRIKRQQEDVEMRARLSDKPRKKGASTQRRRLQEITGTAVECGSIGRQVEMTCSLEAGRRCSGISCSLLKTSRSQWSGTVLTAKTRLQDDTSSIQSRLPASSVQARATAPYGTTEEESLSGSLCFPHI